MLLTPLVGVSSVTKRGHENWILRVGDTHLHYICRATVATSTIAPQRHCQTGSILSQRNRCAPRRKVYCVLTKKKLARRYALRDRGVTSALGALQHSIRYIVQSIYKQLRNQYDCNQYPHIIRTTLVLNYVTTHILTHSPFLESNHHLLGRPLGIIQSFHHQTRACLDSSKR